MHERRSSARRFVVWLPYSDYPWKMEAARPVDRPLSGGERTMHELSVAVASLGHDVEIRGTVNPVELDRLAVAAGARPALPEDERAIGLDDVVLISEGVQHLTLWARLALTGARVIVVALAPIGMFGWGFDGPSGGHDLDTMAIDAVGRTDQLQAIGALGFDLWTHMPELARRAEAAGVRSSFIGNGRPTSYPDANLARVHDVATIKANRWAAAADRVITQLPPAARHVAISGSNADVLAALAATRVLVHPVRIEGHSRLGCEARAMGCVPLVLDSNPFAVGLDAVNGALVVSSVEEMAPALIDLLGDPERWAELSERGRRTAREQVDWERYRERVQLAIDAPHEASAARALHALGDQLARRERDVIATIRAGLTVHGTED